MGIFWKTQFINPPEAQGQVVRLDNQVRVGRQWSQGIKIPHLGQQENGENFANSLLRHTSPDKRAFQSLHGYG